MSAEPFASPPSEIDFDHTDRTFMQNPYDTFRRMREECPVARSTRFDGFWVLSRYDDLVAAARDHETYSSAGGVSIPNFGSPVPLVPVEVDPPVHSAFRRLLQREFSRARMSAFGESISALTDELIDSFVERGSADLATELCAPLPSIVIAQLLGLPRADWKLFGSYTERLLETAKADDFEGNIAASQEFMAYLAGALDRRRREPGDDMLTRIVRAEIGGRPITEDEALGMTVMTVVAGHGTTVGGLGFLLLHVARVPGLRERIIADPALVPKAVEEALRIDPPLHGMGRTVAKDICLHGRQLREGDKVFLLWSSGNRDPEQYDHPETFDVDRSPNRHLTFGEGIHRCVGAPLAQLEMRIVLERVLSRIPDYRVEDWDAVYFSNGQQHTVASLPVVWDPAPPS